MTDDSSRYRANSLAVCLRPLSFDGQELAPEILLCDLLILQGVVALSFDALNLL